MTDNPRMTDDSEERPSTEEAARVIQEDPALNSFSSDPGDADAATDDDARTADQAHTGEVRDR